MENLDGLSVIVFGANGFIGASLTRYLARKGLKVTAIVRYPRRAWRLKDLDSNIEIRVGDVRSRNVVKTLLHEIEPDGVINTAVFGGYPFQTSTEDIFSTNFEGSRIVAEEALEGGASWCINTGSSSEYGMKSENMSETDILEPNDDYGVSKAASTLFCSALARRTGFPLFTLRLFSVYGPFEESTRLIPHLLLSGIRKETALLSSPDPVRDFIYVDDVSDAYLTLIRNQDRLGPGETFNVGTGSSTKVGDVVQIVSSILPVQLNVQWKSNPGRKSDVAREWAANMSKTQEVLKWNPQHDLRAGLQSSYEWFVKNHQLYRS